MTQMADVWDIEEYDNAIWFRTNTMLFELRGNTFKTYIAPAEWRKMYKTEKGLYVQDYNTGLIQFDNGKWKIDLRRQRPEENAGRPRSMFIRMAG